MAEIATMIPPPSHRRVEMPPTAAVSRARECGMEISKDYWKGTAVFMHFAKFSDGWRWRGESLVSAIAVLID